MDILFSPYGVGGIPKAAMAEVERCAEDLLKSGTLQEMLDKEKKNKLQRGRGTPDAPPESSISSAGPRHAGDAPSQLLRSPLQPQDQLMPKRRGTPLPALSIAIPQSADAQVQEDTDEKTPTQLSQDHEAAREFLSPEPSHKQVKFVPIDGEEDDDSDDAMSEQSSICQSPSWEGYGQRKREKKLEAERKKKEREQAEKEAKAARKRLSSRLSKAPPTSTAIRGSNIGALTDTERSMSDPLLIGKQLAQQPSRATQPFSRAISADDLQQNGQPKPNAVATKAHLGGGTRMTWERELAMQIALRDQHASAVSNHSVSQSHVVPDTTTSGSSTQSTQPPSSSSSSRSESRSFQGAFPPSASRTPMLRQPPVSANNRSNSLLHGAVRLFRGRDGKGQGEGVYSTVTNRSQESLKIHSDADRGRQEAHTLYQREHSRDRIIGGIDDDHLAGESADHGSSRRSSSRNTQSGRRSSLTQEAKAAAMKLVGIRTPPTDYFSFSARPYTASVEGPPPTFDTTGTFSSRGSRINSPSEATFPHASTTNYSVSDMQERGHTAQSPVSSRASSAEGTVTTNYSKKGRNIRTLTVESLGNTASASTTHASPPSPYTFSSRMQAQNAALSDGIVDQPHSESAPLDDGMHDEELHVSRPVDAETTAGSRTSEASSSSSAYEDGSPLPSPTTTPDTSRPQSTRDMPLAIGEFVKSQGDSSSLQDDERTLRQSLDSSKSSTPRLPDSDEERPNPEGGPEDRWSRSALPLDIDCDAQSFTTSVEHPDDFEGIDEQLSGALENHLSEKTLPSVATANEGKKRRSETQPSSVELKGPKSDLESPPVDLVLSIPPRSKKREQAAVDRNRTAPRSGEPSPAAHAQAQTVQLSEVPRQDDMKTDRAVPAEKQHMVEKTAPAGRDAVLKTPRRKREADGVKARGHRRSPGSKDMDTAAEAGWKEEEHGGPQAVLSVTPSTEPVSPTRRPLSPEEFDIPANPYITDIAEATMPRNERRDTHPLAPNSSSTSLPALPRQSSPKPPSQPRTMSSPALPVSILKQPKRPAPDASQQAPAGRPPVLSALPKHMQLQAGMGTRSPPPAGETRMAPIAKMFVECCSCKFYHDMPSKIYECMAKPDAVVEDRVLGISGAITTMVKCPWCQHNMSTSCCAGYAAVVYLKEKLH